MSENIRILHRCHFVNKHRAHGLLYIYFSQADKDMKRIRIWAFR